MTYTFTPASDVRSHALEDPVAALPPSLDYPPRPDRPRRDRRSRYQSTLVFGLSVLLGGVGVLVAWPWTLKNKVGGITQTPAEFRTTGTLSLPSLEQLAPPRGTTLPSGMDAPLAVPALELDPLDQLYLAVPPTTATSSTTTTRPAPLPPPALKALTKSGLFPNVQLTVAIDPPGSNAPRTGQFRVETEFGDSRVLQAVRIDFGDGSVTDGAIHQWACWNSAAPNPYLFSGPTHAYSEAGSYIVTVTVQTAACTPGDDDPGTAETARMQLVVNVA